MGSHIFRLLAGWQFPLITSDEKRKRRPLHTQVLRLYWPQLVHNLNGLRAQIGHCECRRIKPHRHAWHDYHRAVQVTPQHTHAHSICMWGHCGCNCFTVFLGILCNVWLHVLNMHVTSAFSLIVGSHAAIGKHDSVLCGWYYMHIYCKCLCGGVCVYVCVCVCVCVCVPVSAEAKKVGQKCGRSAANESGIRMVENCGFYLVSSLFILVNPTPLGRVYTCVIFCLRR